jgi:shikimate kinase
VAADRHIALVGFMAAGKTTIGRHLALELGLPFIDTDELIVAAHGPIPDLFAARGEAGFRAAECDAVAAALAGEPAVLALGGGAMTYAPTREAVRAGAVSVYLEIAPEELVRRLRRSRVVRPLIGPEPTLERVRELLAAREPLYRLADVTVAGPHPTRTAYARAIASRLREYAR